MRTELVVRFDYGSVVPWVSKQEDGRLEFTAGPDRLMLDTEVPTRGEDFRDARRVRDRGWTGSHLRSDLDAVVPRGAGDASPPQRRWSKSSPSGRDGLRRSSLANTGATRSCVRS